MRIFIPKTDQLIKNLNDQYTSLTSEVKDLKSQLSTLNDTHRKLRESVSIAEHGKVQLQRELADLEKVLLERQGILDEIISKLSYLEKIGVTLDIVSQIHGMEVNSGEDLLNYVQTVADFLQAQKELNRFKDSKRHLEEAIVMLTKQKGTLKTDIRSQQNTLDQLMIQIRTIRNAVDMVTELFTEGYTTEDLRSLKTGLDLLGVKGDSTFSLRRLVTGLENVKNLTTLNNQIQEKEKQLKTLTANINKAKGELNSYQEIVIKTLNEAKVQTVTDETHSREDLTRFSLSLFDKPENGSKSL